MNAGKRMAYVGHEAVLNEGVEAWNQWRNAHPKIAPDLSDLVLSGLNIRGANFSNTIMNGCDLNNTDLRGVKFDGANLSDANLSDVNLSSANLRSADLRGSDLRGAWLSNANLRDANLRDTQLSHADLSNTDLHGADLRHANISGTNLNYADLRYANMSAADLTGATFIGADLRDAIFAGANLSDTDFRQANLSGADLRNTNLQGSILIKANLDQADISGSRIYGITAWNLDLNDTIQNSLIISPEGEPEISVDSLEMAELLHLLVYKPNMRYVVDSVKTQAVLVIGQFTAERQAMLEGIRETLRQYGYMPIVLDFDQYVEHDMNDTLVRLGSLSRFVIADLSDPNSIAYEMVAFAEFLTSVPLQGIFCSTHKSAEQHLIFEHLQRLPHVLPVYRYETTQGLMAALGDKVIQPAEEMMKSIRLKNRLA